MKFNYDPFIYIMYMNYLNKSQSYIWYEFFKKIIKIFKYKKL
jgi:hypothetical protein